MKLDTLLERNPDLMAADMDGEMVMMSVSQGSYFAINEVGALIWSTLETPKTVSEITDAVKAAFDNQDAGQIQKDVTHFLADLVENKLIHKTAV